ncbi:MAG: mobile mystery protein A [Gemmatimonadota bacterium]|nr:mobile mystery protein A [Gemmatimonadota bacterium]
MNTPLKKLRVRQLEARAQPIRGLAETPPPRGGWLRAVRLTLGMSARQVASRLGITRQGVADQERREVDGTITLAALRKAARALDCDLYYAIVPRRPTGEILRERARRVAATQLRRIAHSMNLEEQHVPGSEFQLQVEDLADQILREMPRSIWDEPEE